MLLGTAASLTGAEPTDEVMERFRRGVFDLPTLMEVLPRLADPTQRAAIHSTLIESNQAPRSELVSLLGHPMLAVRLGALEILEEMAGGDFSYNPWAPADSPENAAAVARWQVWAKDPGSPPSKGIFSDDQRRGYLQDILGDDADKATRARRMLEAEGLSAVGFLETFLARTPALNAGHRARVREAQYQITLARQLGDQAAVNARQLAFGSRDQILSALTTVRDAGSLALPILRDFINHPDPLVRESAIDSLLVAGGEPAVEIVGPLLKVETDVNVIHGALRRLKDVPGTKTAELVATFLNHPDEDLLISAIQTSLTLSGDNERSSGSSSQNKPAAPADKPVLAALTDKRWRVRAAALEYVAKRSLSAAKESCLALLDDPDDFVRFAAIKAISTLGARDALPKLKAMFLKDESMAGPVMEGYGALNQTPDAEILNRLDAAASETKLAALRAIESNRSLSSLALRYATDSNIDVACAALRDIAADSENLTNNRNASVLVEALRSGSPPKVEAVLERLELPESKRIDPSLVKMLDASSDGETTALDPLYQAFELPGADDFVVPGEGEKKPKTVPTIPGASEELMRELIRRTSPETTPGDRFRAALNLAKAARPEGYATLLRDLPSLTTAQKTAIAEDLGEPSVREAGPLLTALLRDPVSEVRAGGASAAMANDKVPYFSNLVLEELMRPGTPLEAHEVYDYHFESISRSQKPGAALRKWATGVLDSADAKVPLKVLATIALSQNPPTAGVAALEKCTSSPSPLLRRAAWYALLTAKPARAATSAEAILADAEARVRMVLPVAVDPSRSEWMHYFSDLNVLPDHNWSSSSSKAKLAEPLKNRLAEIAAKDPAPVVRFEAAFTLLKLGVKIDPDELAALIPTLPKEVDARRRLGWWLSQNAQRATPGLRPLLLVIDTSRVEAKNLKLLNDRVNPAPKGGFATFASLADADATKPAGDLLTPEAAPAATVDRKSLAVVYFFKPGCPECARVKEYLAAIHKDFPSIELHEHNILESGGTLYNQALCNRFEVPSAKQTLAPAIFTQAGFVIRDDISPRSLAELFTKTMGLTQDDAWMAFSTAETKAADQAVVERYSAFTLPVVAGAGLLDGVNPCAFATIIFFLSYLQIARRTPREMLMVGASFIIAVFITYFAAGLLLYQTIAVLNEKFSGIQKWMNLGFALLAILAALLSFRDAWRAHQGRMGEMTLQLPGFMKDRIRGVIRTGAKARNFVIAAFLAGIVISLLELACTGQVYAPIIYQIQQGKLNAVGWLAIYNVAFILPLIVIFLLAYGGLRSETLVAVQKKHTAAVKIGLGILFVVLAVMILAGQKWLVSK